MNYIGLLNKSVCIENREMKKQLANTNFFFFLEHNRLNFSFPGKTYGKTFWQRKTVVLV